MVLDVNLLPNSATLTVSEGVVTMVENTARDGRRQTAHGGVAATEIASDLVRHTIPNRLTTSPPPTSRTNSGSPHTTS